MSGPRGNPIIGTQILGQYRVVGERGHGGMGTIYLAEQVSMDRYAAIKFVADRGPRATEWRRRFRLEARAASRLLHPHIVTVYNFSELANGALFLAMEYLQGVNLRDAIGAGPLGVDKALELASQCAAALGHAHDHGVVHRDFKPENIIITEISNGDHVKVLDFGIAQIVEDDSNNTEEGALLGTPRYLSPEHCGGEASTELSDQYALGLVLYEMLTGRCAIESESVIGYLEAHRTQSVKPPSTHEVRCSSEVDALVLRMLAKEPGARYAHMNDVIAAIATARQSLAQITTVAGATPASGGAADLRKLISHMRFATLDGMATAEALARTRASLRTQELSGPRPVRSIALPELLSRDGTGELAALGFVVDASGAADNDVSTVELSASDLVVATSNTLLASRVDRAELSARTLFCSDGKLAAAGIQRIAERHRHLLVGEPPVEPLVLATALRWIDAGEGVGIERAASDRAVQVIQLTSSTRTSAYVDALVDDASAQGVRRWALKGLAELCEELIMNAIFHAPVDTRGEHIYTDLPRTETLEMRPGQEPVLRWVVLPRFVAVSVRDPFGSLAIEQVIEYLLGEPERPKERRGAGKGLQVAWRAARHLIVGSAPGSWCEIVGLVPREPTRARTLSLLRLASAPSSRIGDKLSLHETVRGEVTQLEVRGSIDESSDLTSVYNRDGKVSVDLSQVERINSPGVRAWCEAARVPEKLELSFERCSLAVVSQLSMNPELTEAVRVESVFAPYYCEACKEEALKLVHASELDKIPPERRCGRCGDDLSFDALPEEFFAFLE